LLTFAGAPARTKLVWQLNDEIFELTVDPSLSHGASSAHSLQTVGIFIGSITVAAASWDRCSPWADWSPRKSCAESRGRALYACSTVL